VIPFAAERDGFGEGRGEVIVGVRRGARLAAASVTAAVGGLLSTMTDAGAMCRFPSLRRWPRRLPETVLARRTLREGRLCGELRALVVIVDVLPSGVATVKPAALKVNGTPGLAAECGDVGGSGSRVRAAQPVGRLGIDGVRPALPENPDTFVVE